MPKQSLKEQTAQQPQPQRQTTRVATLSQKQEEQGQTVQTQQPQPTLRSAATSATNTHTIDTQQTHMHYPQALTLTTSMYRDQQQGMPLQREDEAEEPYIRYKQDREEEKLYITRLPSIARRYQTQVPAVRQEPNIPARARREDPHTESLGKIKKPKREFHPAFALGIALICVCVGITVAIVVPPQVQKWRDQQTYGYPRTYQTDANVGHSSQTAPTSHFIAWNDNGTIKVLDIPEGDPTTYKPHLYIITTFSGPDADLIPVTIRFASQRHNGKLDLLILCNGTEFVMYNNGQLFTPQAS